jgi:hypothetical protein
MGVSFLRNQTLLRCAVVALAVERYRVVHNRWPDSLDSLVPQFLAKVPLDPYDAKPLRYRRLEDGVVIFALGPDGKDYGGKLDPQKQAKPGTNLGFRLWDVTHRREAWRPPVKTTDEQDD